MWLWDHGQWTVDLASQSIPGSECPSLPALTGAGSLQLAESGSAGWRTVWTGSSTGPALPLVSPLFLVQELQTQLSVPVSKYFVTVLIQLGLWVGRGLASLLSWDCRWTCHESLEG